MVKDLRHYDFNLFNIRRIAVEMNAEIFKGVEESIEDIFEKLTAQHAWYPECSYNFHYYNGWAHNKVHKINTKVIIPSHGLFPDYSWSNDVFRVREAYRHLADIEKVFNYLDGHTTAEVSPEAALQQAYREGCTRNIPCKFFTVTFYKKGTTHIKFTNQALLDKFNIYAARRRNWLPPSYGRKAYRDMNGEERRVVDEFQGEEAYGEVVKNPSYYLVEAVSLPSLPAAV